MAHDSQREWLNRQLLPDQKERIRLAARLRGMSISEFGVTTLDEAAIRTIAEHEARATQPGAHELFLKPLDPRDPAPAIRTVRLNETWGRFLITPLKRGLAAILGPVLHTMITWSNESIVAPAVTAIRIAGAASESPWAIPGVVENGLEIGRRLANVAFRMKGDDARSLHLKLQGPGVIASAQIEAGDDVEVLDRDVELCTVSDAITFAMEIRLKRGRGVVAKSANRKPELGEGFIALDSTHCPLRDVRFRTSHAGGAEGLVVEIETSGSVSPAKLLGVSLETLRENVSDPAVRRKNLSRELDELGSCPLRTWNCLRNAGVTTVGALIRKTEADLVKLPGSGRKVLAEAKEMLTPLGLSLGMTIDGEGYPQPGPTSVLSSAIHALAMLRLDD